MKKYVLVGTGYRGLTAYAKPMADEFQDVAKLCGFYDVNPVRAKFASDYCGGVPVFDSFEKMLEEVKPDCVIISPIDAVHHIYAVKAMEMGCDIILEKPMTIGVEECNAIMAAEKRTGRKVTVVFNMRFRRGFTKVKQLLEQGVIGEVLHVNVEWVLDIHHGADYFRRWHRQMKNSGGLLLQKSTHHFDMVNWCLNDTPETVFAFGTRRFYGLDDGPHGERCFTCDFKQDCMFYMDIDGEQIQKELYHNSESGDGYIRDTCPFAKGVDIYDNMSVNVTYQSGALLTYSLVTNAPYEGWKMTITGTKGRIETENVLRGVGAEADYEHVRVYDLAGNMTDHNLKKLRGTHGGADSVLRRLLFRGGVEDTAGLTATSIDGAKSALVGICANISIAEGRVVNIKEILDSYQ